MRNSKLGLRALGLAILGALSLTAFFAGGASATSLPSLSTVGAWLIELGLALLATVGGTQQGVKTILVQGRNLSIDCTGGSVTNGKIDSHTDMVLTLLLTGCVAWNLALTTKLPCEVLSPGEPTGSVAATALVLPILHGGEDFVLFEPQTLDFTTIELHGATCPLPLLNPLKGSYCALLDDEPSPGVHTPKPLLLFSPTIQLLCGDKLTLGGFPMYLHATFHLFLTGEHEGLDLGAH